METLIEEIVRAGVPVTLEYNIEKDLVMYNVNTEAKSGLRLYKRGSTWHTKCRYDSLNTSVVDFEDLAWNVRECMCGKDYVASHWMSVFAKFGIVETKEVTTTSYVWK